MFHWPGMKPMVHEYINRCDACKLHKGERIHVPGLLQPLPIPEEAWNSIAMDFRNGLPK